MVRAGLAVIGLLLLAPPSAAADAVVTIDNFSFTPAQITVAPGTRVQFVNHDDMPHTVVDAATPRRFKSPPLDTGDSWDHVFDAPGRYDFVCSLHGYMTGIVIVQ